MITRINKIILILSIGIPFLYVPYTYAHSGRTDSYGCHTCRTNCYNWGLSTGEYHCHQAKSLPQPEAPVTSTRGNPGYTQPAPEYSKPTITTDYPSEDEDSSYGAWGRAALLVGGGLLFYRFIKK